MAEREIPKNEISYDGDNIATVVTYTDVNRRILAMSTYSLVNGIPMVKHFDEHHGVCDVDPKPDNDAPEKVLEILSAGNRAGVKILREQGRIDDFIDA